jgi:hypothetical protein
VGDDKNWSAQAGYALAKINSFDPPLFSIPTSYTAEPSRRSRTHQSTVPAADPRSDVHLNRWIHFPAIRFARTEPDRSRVLAECRHAP